MKPHLEEPASAVSWTLILMMILFVFALGCCCGALAFCFACRQQRQVAATPALPARALERPALDDAGRAVAAEALADDAAVVDDLVGLRQRSAVPVAPAARRACAHSRNQKVSGSNQWIDRLLCLTCGETFDQDTRLNVERKAAAAAVQ